MQELAEAMMDFGIDPPTVFYSDGKIHRFGKDKAGWYVLHSDPPCGAFGYWGKVDSTKWRAKREFSDEENKAYREKMELSRRLREEDNRKRREECRETARRLWDWSMHGTNEYLKRKGIKPHGTKINRGSVVVPVRDIQGTIHGLQFIRPNGEKMFLGSTAKKGCYFSIGRPKGTICICEGFATGASIYECTGIAVAIAFDAGNLVSVASNLKKKFPKISFIIGADNDKVGLEKAYEAAKVCFGRVVVPDWEGYDFNDLHQKFGADRVLNLFTK